jgi:hypothetical protein
MKVAIEEGRKGAEKAKETGETFWLGKGEERRKRDVVGLLLPAVL